MKPRSPMLRTAWRCALAACLVLVAVYALAAEEPARPAVADACSRDLAKRLGIEVNTISVARAAEVTWPDASLGLPKPNEMYAQVLTPGWALLLKSPKGQFLYTTSQTRFRYGGCAQMWAYSALFLLPIPDEPNLNADLYQISLAGTNPTLLLREVNSFRAQPNGSIIAARRTSRSGHDLLYLAPAETGKEHKLASGLAFGDSAVSPDGKDWLAFRKPRLGAPWEIVGRALEGDLDSLKSLALPEGTRPDRLFWEPEGHIAAMLVAGEQRVAYELLREGDKWSWRKLDHYTSPEGYETLLSKSESLEVSVRDEAGKPVTRVATVWFTGDVTSEVELEGFGMKTFRLTPCQRFVLLSGVEGETAKAYTVDMVTGEKFVCATEFTGDVQLFLAPPRDAAKIPVLREP